MITASNITAHELVGLTASVLGAANTQLIGLNGTIIDETKSMLALRTMVGTKHVPKAGTVFELALGTGSTVVHGSDLRGRPHSRQGLRR